MVAFSLLTACAKRENKDIDASFFQSPSTVLIAEVGGLGSPKYHIEMGDSNAGLIGALVMSVAQGIAGAANSDAIEVVEAMQLFHLSEQHYHKPFSQAFRDKGVLAQNMLSPLLPEGLQAIEDDKIQPPYDFKFLKDHHNVDYVFVMIPGGTRIIRYPGLFGHSIAQAALNFYLIKLMDNTVSGYFSSSVNLPIADDWDNPPDYPRLTSGIEESIRLACQNALLFFFKDNVKNECS